MSDERESSPIPTRDEFKKDAITQAAKGIYWDDGDVDLMRDGRLDMHRITFVKGAMWAFYALGMTRSYNLRTENCTPTKAESDGDFLRRVGMDGDKWASEFVERFRGRVVGGDVDHGLMLGWFCNAIMAGFDKASRDKDKRIAELERINGEMCGQSITQIEGLKAKCADLERQLATERADNKKMFADWAETTRERDRLALEIKKAMEKK